MRIRCGIGINLKLFQYIQEWSLYVIISSILLYWWFVSKMCWEYSDLILLCQISLICSLYHCVKFHVICSTYFLLTVWTLQLMNTTIIISVRLLWYVDLFLLLLVLTAILILEFKEILVSVLFSLPL
jgi:hypothetical protein